MKTGLDFFPFDIDFFDDEKVEFISALYGHEAELMTIKLLCRIYRQGYFLNWDEDQALLFAKRVNISFENVNSIIKELLKREFFDGNLYKKYNVLTSRGIQKRFFDAAKRRKEIEVYKEYILVNIDILPENVNILSINVNISKQRKEVKEGSKGRNSIPYSEIISLYHEILPELPRVAKLTDKRKAQIKARWYESGKTQNVEWWKEYFEIVKERPFLLGNNDRGWTADIDFLTTQSKFIKIIEGKYKEKY